MWTFNHGKGKFPIVIEGWALQNSGRYLQRSPDANGASYNTTSDAVLNSLTIGGMTTTNATTIANGHIIYNIIFA